jgi:hypothetical protein
MKSQFVICDFFLILPVYIKSYGRKNFQWSIQAFLLFKVSPTMKTFHIVLRLL